MLRWALILARQIARYDQNDLANNQCSAEHNKHMLTMKLTRKTLACLMTVGLLTTLTAMTATAAAPALNAQLVLRPLTPGDVTNYKLPSTIENSGGLSTVGVGAAVYLEADINSAIAPSNILSVTFVLTNKPPYSAAALAASPLPANLPPYDVNTRSSLQVAGRMLLRADLVGQYTNVATIVTSGSGTVANVTNTITAAPTWASTRASCATAAATWGQDRFTT